MKQVSKTPFRERIISEAGYRLSDCGNQVVAPNGRLIKPRLGNRGYWYFFVRLPHKRAQVLVHRLQAYQKFGDAIYGAGVEVRHINSNRHDNSSGNIRIGSHQENMMDTPSSLRSERARQARQKYNYAEVGAFLKANGRAATMLRFGIPHESTLSFILRKLGLNGHRKAA